MPHARLLLGRRCRLGRVGKLVWRVRILEASVAILPSMRRRSRVSKLLRAVLHVAVGCIRDAWRC
jgi:hypothetical protein